MQHSGGERARQAAVRPGRLSCESRAEEMAALRSAVGMHKDTLRLCLQRRDLLMDRLHVGEAKTGPAAPI